MGATRKPRKLRAVFSIGMPFDVVRLVARAAKRQKVTRNGFIVRAAEQAAQRELSPQSGASTSAAA